MSTLGGVGGFQSGPFTISSSGRTALLQEGTFWLGSTDTQLVIGSLKLWVSTWSLVGSITWFLISSSDGSKYSTWTLVGSIIWFLISSSDGSKYSTWTLVDSITWFLMSSSDGSRSSSIAFLYFSICLVSQTPEVCWTSLQMRW